MKNMRLIDADALKKEIESQGILGSGYSDEERLKDVLKIIDEAQTIEYIY